MSFDFSPDLSSIERWYAFSADVFDSSTVPHGLYDPYETFPGTHSIQVRNTLMNHGVYPAHRARHERPTAWSFPDWPMDIFLVFLRNCPPDVLARLSATCSHFQEYCLPILYEDVNLAFKSWDRGLSQMECMQHILRRPELAPRVKSLSFTMGLVGNRKPDQDLFETFNLLENVEHVEIDAFASYMYPATEVGLGDAVFPNARSIKLKGHMTYYMAKKILISGTKEKLETVELDVQLHNFPERFKTMTGGSTTPSERAVSYLIAQARLKSVNLRKWIIDGFETVL